MSFGPRPHRLLKFRLGEVSVEFRDEQEGLVAAVCVEPYFKITIGYVDGRFVQTLQSAIPIVGSWLQFVRDQLVV